MKRIAFGTATLLALAGTASASDNPQRSSRNASIPFVNHGGIRDWQAPNNRTLYVQSRNRQWFRAELMGPCQGLDFADRIGFHTGPSNTFDRFSSIVVRGRRCHIASLERADGPARGAAHHPMPPPKP